MRKMCSRGPAEKTALLVKCSLLQSSLPARLVEEFLLLPLHQGPQPCHSVQEHLFTCLRPDQGGRDFIGSQLHRHCLGRCWANLLNEKKMEE